MNEALKEMPEITRVEVIDHREGGEGRVFVVRKDPLEGPGVTMALQDNGRTLKIFLSEKRPST